MLPVNRKRAHVVGAACPNPFWWLGHQVGILVEKRMAQLKSGGMRNNLRRIFLSASTGPSNKMDINLQKAIASSRTVDSLRLLMMSHIEGASGTSQLLYEQLIATEMQKLKVEPRDFFQTIISILTQIRNTFPENDNRVMRWSRTVAAQTPSAWASSSLNETITSRPSLTDSAANLTGEALSEASNSRVFREVSNCKFQQNQLKPEPINPIDPSRSSQRLAIKKRNRLDQPELDDTDEYSRELTGFNPNVTMRRIKKPKVRPKKELRTPVMIKKKRGRPMKICNQRQLAINKNPTVKKRRGRPPSIRSNLSQQPSSTLLSGKP
ncbi:hypothetical protein M3Y97_01001500 [Aphelenchoides bicaudatus]|nr:hypothetical protein M3Y97_01001500 [Aphelenchoides bicaudatus]